MTLTTKPWDITEHLDTPEAIAAYVEAAFEDGDPALITAVIGDVARARGMTQLARDAGVSRETIYKAFSEGGNPTLETLTGVIRALGLKLAVHAA
ncbi:addiction module antidote protein [Phyllobacterium bourgognense]|uniref:Putative addiction module antidote protein n=1 Tax=Phyllobacterium bourgognense TaxID=314236 RepID=A0A368YZW0_9HYPH|nr:addiction module antidote protein [Phyllobacterium bourgognense]RCW83724.1 putative addiction module antidote protein [Phyllobacterium bourgognense]